MQYEDNIMIQIGTLVKTTRKEQGITQEDLAGISGTGKRFISDVENGKSSVQFDKLLLVLGALGLTLSIINKWNKS